MVVKKIAKVLHLKKLSELINFNMSLTLNNKKMLVPVVKNMGLLNLSVKNDWFLQLFKSFQLPADTSFIDVGVNVGQTLLTFRSCFNNPYWGFEPNPACIYYLNLLIKANNFNSTKIIPVGLSSKNQVVKFYSKNDVDSAGTTINDLRPDFYDTNNVNYVPLFCFDNLYLDDIKKISFIKIDVEGAELEVLQGMYQTIQKQKPYILCEILDYHSEESKTHMQQKANDLFSYMQALTYDAYRIIHSSDKISLEKITDLKLNKWTPESMSLNDYLFLPQGTDHILLK